MNRIRKIALLCFTLMNCGVLLQAEEIDPTLGVADPDGKTVWHDCKLLKVEGKGWTNTAAFYDRLPAIAERTAPVKVWNLSHNSAGLCVRFTTDSTFMQVRWTLLQKNLAMPHMPATGVSGVDLYGRNEAGKWEFLGNGSPVGVTNTVSFRYHLAKSENMLYLPLYNGVKSIEIGIPSGKTISIPEASPRDHRKPVVFYGTSITQGGCASRPGMAATAIVSRELDVPVINLGFSGSGKMELEMAILFKELDPSVYVLDCGPNIPTVEMLNERVEPFVLELRQAHPKTPILLVEGSNFRNRHDAGGRALRTIHEKLLKDGIEGLYFLSNEGMLGEDSEGTVDGCHHTDLGMMRQSAVFVKALAPLLSSVEK